MTPEEIKELIDKYHDYVNKGEKMNYLEFLRLFHGLKHYFLKHEK